MYRQKRIALLAAFLWLLLTNCHAGIQLSQERAVEKPVDRADQIDGSAGVTRVAREPSGLGKRQELYLGDQVPQKPTGVGSCL